MPDDKKIAGVIATYNRASLLMRCLAAISGMTVKPHTVYIVDNASTDNTADCVRNGGFYNEIVNGIHFEYIEMPSNQGGAGAFYTGMKTAYESPEHFDGIWVMDDDGTPDAAQLAYMAPYLETHDYIAPLVQAEEEPESLAFPFREVKTVAELQGKYPEYVEGYACPFNGILYSRRLIEKIGLPNPDLFIWGDEENYNARAIYAGFQPITVTRAIHIHPKCKDVFFPSFGKFRVVFVPQKWKAYCHYRNKMYNSRWIHHSPLKRYIAYYVVHAYFFLFRKRSLSWFMCFHDAFVSGIRGKLGGHMKYMN